MMKNRLLSLVAIGATAMNTVAQTTLKNGDLLFCVSDTASATEFARSIVGSTKGVEQKKIDHVAIVSVEDDGTYIIEATAKHGVWKCSLSEFVENADKGEDGKPLLLVGRVKGDVDIESSIMKAKSFIGRKYDFVFSPTDDEMYCSELVQKSYVKNNGDLLFEPIPMSFHDEEGRILPYWFRYYETRNMEVPEGEPGSNPGDLSRRGNVEILDFQSEK